MLKYVKIYYDSNKKCMKFLKLIIMLNYDRKIKRHKNKLKFMNMPCYIRIFYNFKM